MLHKQARDSCFVMYGQPLRELINLVCWVISAFIDYAFLNRVFSLFLLIYFVISRMIRCIINIFLSAD
jgi:hypothetical protein